MRKSLFSSILALLALPAIGSADIVINEINYDPYGADNSSHAEWVELYNTDSTSVDLTGYTVQAGSFELFTFPAGATIAGKGFVLIQYGELHRFAAYYKSGIDTSIVYNFTIASGASIGSKLAQGGTTITLKDTSSNTIDAVTYDDAPPWPVFGDRSAGSTGLTYELIDPALDNNDGANWRVSVSPSGTPGKWNSTAGFWYTNAGRNIVAPGPSDSISISLETSGTVASVQAFVAQGTGNSTYTPVTLTQAGNVFTGALGTFPDKTLVKYYFKLTGTNGAEVFYPFLAPAVPEMFFVDSAPPTSADIVINEIMANPKGSDNKDNSEFIELRNQSLSPIDVSGYIVGRTATDPYWNIIPEGTILQPRDQAGSYVVAAGRKELITGVDPAVTIVDMAWTPTLSVLANGNSQVFYARPNAFDWNDIWTDLTLVPVTTVAYTSGANGWPTLVDGRSYELKDPTLDPAIGSNWANSLADHGTPGAYNSTAGVKDWSVY